MEEHKDNLISDIILKHKGKSENNLIGNLFIPRDIQNTNTLIFSKLNAEKYSWEVDGAKILNPDKTKLNEKEIRILKALIIKKTPDNYRKRLWVIASGARQEMKNNPQYYFNLTRNFPSSLPSPYEALIDNDVERTFPEDQEFEESGGVVKLKNILLAYSRRNISIGYCQGFNFIAGRILQVIPIEEEAFWVFVQVIESILPLNYFSGMVGVLVDSTFITGLVQHYLPDLYSFILSRSFEVSLTNLIYRWLVSLYVQNLSYKFGLLIWDVLFLEGNITLFKASLGLLKCLKNEIMKQNTIEDINCIFEQGPVNMSDISSLIYYLIFRKFEFDQNFIIKGRFALENQIIETMFKEKIMKASKEKEKMVDDIKTKRIKKKELKISSYFKSKNDCDPNWQLCIYDTYYKHEIKDYFIYKVSSPMNIIETFYFDKVSDFNSNKSFCDSQNSNEISSFTGTKKTQFHRDGDYSSIGSKSLSSFFAGVNVERSEKNTSYIEKISSGEEGDEENIEEEEEEENINIYDETNSNGVNTTPLSEYQKLEFYKSLLIERRSHFCELLPNRKEKVLYCQPRKKFRLFESQFLKLKNRKRKKTSLNQANKSFTGVHPYFMEFYGSDAKVKKVGSTISQNELVYINMISRMTREKENLDYIEEIEITPFTDENEGESVAEKLFSN